MAERSSTDYWKVICDQRDQILTLIKETGWIEVKNKRGIRISYRNTGSARPGRMVHVEAELDVSPATAKQYFTPGPKGVRDKFQNSVKEVNIIQEADNYLLVHEVLPGNAIISERDTVCVYGGEDDCDIGAYLMAPSIELPDYSPRPKVVRVTKYTAGFVFLRVDGNPNRCVLHGVARIDLGGKLPLPLVRSVLLKTVYKNIKEIKWAIANKLHEQSDYYHSSATL